MEIQAVLEGLKLLKEPCKVKVHSDSAYVVNAIKQGWLKGWKKRGWKRSNGPLLNKELWQEMDRLLSIHDVEFVKVKGHSDNELNNRGKKKNTAISAYIIFILISSTTAIRIEDDFLFFHFKTKKAA